MFITVHDSSEKESEREEREREIDELIATDEFMNESVRRIQLTGTMS